MQHFSIALILILTLCMCGQSRAQCKGLGQYCTAHSDCCSSSCLSFSYKCVERHDHQYDTQHTTINNIDVLVDNFSGDSIAATNTYQTNPSEMPSTTFPVQTDQPPVTTNEIVSSKSVCRANGNLCSTSDQCCTNFCSKITNSCIQPTTDSSSTEQITAYTGPAFSSITPGNCKEIGQKCYATATNECCPPLRCHGFLHQCVT